LDDKTSGEPTIAESHPSAPRPAKPRVWTVFVVVILALIAAIVFQSIAGIALVFWEASQGADPREVATELPNRLGTPILFMLMAACGQLAFAVAVLLPAWWSPVPVRERLGLYPARPSASIYPLATFGSLFPLAIGFAIAQPLTAYLPGDLTVQTLFENMTLGVGIVFVVFIALVPGVVEELLFRGYVQRRLLARWTPLWAVLISSLLFAFVHIMPLAIIALFPLGIWLGVVAWRSGSVFPSMFCHAFVNGGVNAYRLIVKFGDISETTQTVIIAVALLISLACFLQSLRLFFGRPEPAISVQLESTAE
jgi:membrane protease YdiL (CAAX protease family)